MISKVVLLIVASEGYQPIEYGHTHQMLKEAGFKVEAASDKAGTAYARASAEHAKVCKEEQCTKIEGESAQYAHVAIDVTLSNIDVNKYAGIFIIGGPGALEFLDNKLTYQVMQKFAKTGKPFGAICISPRILAYAGLLTNKKVTGWDGRSKLADIFKKTSGALCQRTGGYRWCHNNG